MSSRQAALLLVVAGMLPVLAARAAGVAPAVPDLRRWSRYSVLTPAGPEEPPPLAFQSLKRLVWADHKLVKGESSAGQLAKTYRTTLPSLQATNNDELYLLGIGRKIKVLNQDGLLYEVKKDSETLDRIVRKFHWEPRQARRFKEWVVKANDLPGSALIGDYEFTKGERVLLPGIKINFDTYHYPVASPRLSSRFGLRRHPIFRERRMHTGIDIAKPYGSPVYSARSGTVIEAGWREGYGMLVIIRHSDGYTTRYGHMSKIMVAPGQVVQRGKTMIGRVGSTGNSTGPHLHFEVRNRSGDPINPSAKIGHR